MESTKKEIKEIRTVNSAVCKVFGVKEESLYNKDRTAKATNARGFAIYVLHKNFGLSASTLSREYNIITRSVFWHTSKINDFIGCYEKYRKIYASICELIK